jgi:hypothetical protein
MISGSSDQSRCHNVMATHPGNPFFRHQEPQGSHIAAKMNWLSSDAATGWKIAGWLGPAVLIHVVPEEQLEDHRGRLPTAGQCVRPPIPSEADGSVRPKRHGLLATGLILGPPWGVMHLPTTTGEGSHTRRR